MKLNTAVSSPVSSNTGNQSNFKINASGQAFRILSDGLYSDKIMAVIRELSCNAYDSHIEAGKEDVPITVQLPNKMNMEFAVEDEGLGLSHEDVTNLFSTYFQSTKSTSNEVTGAFGLGSKSPFSYVDSFTVESVYGGFHRVYTAYISDDEIPAITLMGEEKTDRPNGVRISMPVKANDVNYFESKAKEALEYFPTKPNIVGCSGFTWNINLTSPEYEGENYELYFNYSSSRNNLRVVQGNVAYPLNLNALNISADEQEKITPIVKARSCVIRVPMGSVEIAPSREAISYTKYTNENLMKILTDISDDVREKAKDSFVSEPNYWKAVQNKLKVESLLGKFPVAKNIHHGDLTIALTPKLPSKKGIEIKSVMFGRSSVMSLYNIKVNEDSEFYFDFNRYNFNNIIYSLPTIIVDDITTKKYPAGKRIVSEIHRGSNVIFIVQKTNDKVTTKELNEVANELANNLKLYNPKEHIYSLEDIRIRTKPNKTERQETPQVLKWKEFSYSSWSSGVDLPVDKKNVFYYVPLKRFTVLVDEIKESEYGGDFDSLIKIAKRVVDIDGFDNGVYGVRLKELRKVKKMPNAVNLFDAIDDAIKSFIDNGGENKYLKYLDYNRAERFLEGLFSSTYLYINRIIEYNSIKDTEFAKNVKKIKKYKEDSNNLVVQDILKLTECVKSDIIINNKCEYKITSALEDAYSNLKFINVHMLSEDNIPKEIIELFNKTVKYI